MGELGQLGQLGQLGRRLLAAFVLVALAAVFMVSAAALVGSQRGIAATAARQQVVEKAAALAGAAYEQAGGWSAVNLVAIQEYAQDQGIRLQIVDQQGRPVLAGGQGGGYQQAVVVAGREVGTVRVGFGGSPLQTGRRIAWTWIVTATLTAVLVAVLAGWWVAGRITRPIDQLTHAAAAFAAGDRGVRANLDAPGEIGELARTFDGAADAIQRQETLRRNLSADVAHELRTPLTALLAGLEEVRDGYVPADDQAMTRLHDQALRLQRVVTDLASLADAEATGPLTDLRPVDLARVAAWSAAAHGAALRAAGIELQIRETGPVTAMADPGRVDQIIGNLLSNAARYCRPGDLVTVSVWNAAEGCVLEVADTGPGVSATDLPRLFDRFWRGTASGGGSGLGLAIVQELARSQGGGVRALSDDGQGLTIQVMLPAGV